MVTIAEQYKLKIGDAAPPFRLPATDGRTYSLGSFVGKKALGVVFHCNHCPYAQGFEQRLIDIERDHAPGGFQEVAVNSNDATEYPEDSFDEMKKRAAEKKYNFPYLHDASQQVARAYGAVCTPHVLLFDAKFRLAYQGRVDDNHEAPAKAKTREYRDAIEAVLAGKPVPDPITRAFGCSIKWKTR